MKSFNITKNDANQRLDKFVQKAAPKLPNGLMYKYIRLKRIKVNGARAQISTRLNVGDVVDMYINDEFFAAIEEKYDFLRAGKKLSIVYEDENILLCDKPEGLIVHPDESEYNDTLIGCIKRYLYEKGEYDPAAEQSFTPALVNRIDRNTCGIVIAAKTAAALRILNDKLKNREIEKYYLCIVHGKMSKTSDTLEGYLEKNESQNRVYISDTPRPGARTIRTRYTVLEQRDDLSLLEIHLLTGRTHQIRAHLASIGHPLLGDGKYGTNALNKGTGFHKQALCSYRLQFDFISDAGELEYLNGKEFTLTDVWFADAFRKGEI